MRNDILKSLPTNPGIAFSAIRSIAASVSARQETSDRRSMLQRSALGIGALGLAHVLNADGRANAMEAGPLNDRPSPFLPKAKRVIHFFLNGGPSHVDTFDPKPLLSKYAGQSLGDNLLTERKTGAAFPSPFKFRRYGQSGIEVSEIFSRTAAHIDDIAVIRSMYAQVPNHEPSLMLMNCASNASAMSRAMVVLPTPGGPHKMQL